MSIVGVYEMSYEEPLCRVVEHALNQLSVMIEDGASTSMKINRLRNAFVRILHNMPITCQYIFTESKAYPSFEYILFYERLRMRLVCPYFFFDGVPSGVQLFTGETTIDLPNNEIKKLKLCDVVSDRSSVVMKMESMPRTNERKVSLVAQHTAGLGPAVPGPARFLVARTRAIIRGLRVTKRRETFHHCANCNCNRMFYAGEVAETWSRGDLVEVILGELSDDHCGSDDYWHTISGEENSTVPDTRRFCSRICCRQHNAQLASMMPDFGIMLDVDDYAKKQGRARVGEAFRLALKRNEVAARALRTLRLTSYSNLSVSHEDIERHRQKRITALNVDLGMLYAASVLSESVAMSNGKILPGQCLYWRDDPVFYSKALSHIMKIYNNTKRKDRIVSSMLTKDKFFECISARAHKMF